MKHEFEIEFFDGLKIVVIGNDGFDVVAQVLHRMSEMDNLNPKTNSQTEWRIRSIRYLRESKY